jgi:hypothetical protein
MITRTWNNLSHVAPLGANGVVIQYVGRIAFTRHSWATNKRGALAVSGTVNLPGASADWHAVARRRYRVSGLHRPRNRRTLAVH